MKRITFFITCLPVFFAVSLVFSSCKKNNDVAPIQQNDSLVQISAFYSDSLQIRYNTVVNVPINLIITFYLNDGSQRNLSFAIPAGNENLQKFGVPSSNDYLNVWDDSAGTDSIQHWNTTVDSFKIIKASCSDSHCLFTLLTGNDEWQYYHPTGVKTVVSFIANQDTVLYSDYNLQSSVTRYNAPASVYSFYFFGYGVFMVSGEASFPFQKGATMPIPFITYYWNGVTKGSQDGNPQQSNNGSSVILTVTRLTDTTYDATFSGKQWSSVQQDTIVITNGIIQNALLPVMQ